MCWYQWARRWRPLGDGWDGGHLPAGLSGNLTLFPFKTHGVLFNNGSNFALGKGERNLFRPQLCEGKERKRGGRKGGSPSPGLGGCCQLLLCQGGHVYAPVPSGFGPLFVEAEKEAGVLLPWCSRVPGLFPARRTSSLFYGGIREGGARCPEHCCGATPGCPKKKA